MTVAVVSKRFAPFVSCLLALSLCPSADAAGSATAASARHERRAGPAIGVRTLEQKRAAVAVEAASGVSPSVPNEARLGSHEGVSARLGPPIILRFRDLPKFVDVSRAPPSQRSRVAQGPSKRAPSERSPVERVLETIFEGSHFADHVKPYSAAGQPQPGGAAPDPLPLATFDSAYDIVVFDIPRPLQVLRLYDGVSSKEHGRWVSCCLRVVAASSTGTGVGTWRADLRGLALPPTNTQDYLAIQVIPEGTTVVLGIAKSWSYSVVNGQAVAGVDGTSRQSVEVVGGGVQIYLGNVKLEDSRRFKRHDGVRTEAVLPAGDQRAPIEIETNVLGPDLEEHPTLFWYDPISQLSIAIRMPRAA